MSKKWILLLITLLIGRSAIASSCNQSTLKIVNNTNKEFIVGDIEDGNVNIKCIDVNLCFMESKGKLTNLQTEQRIPAGGSLTATIQSGLGSRGNIWGTFTLHNGTQYIHTDYQFNTYFYGLGKCQAKIDTEVVGASNLKVKTETLEGNPIQVILKISQ